MKNLSNIKYEFEESGLKNIITEKLQMHDNNIALNKLGGTSKIPVKKMKKRERFRERSESTCEFLCFGNCNDEPASNGNEIEVPHLKINKHSLKKNHEDDHYYKFTKSISDKNLNNRFRSDTSRSQN